MKNSLFLLFTLVFVTLGCQKSGSGDSPMDQFSKIPTVGKQGGLTLSNNDFAKYAISSNDVDFVATIEIRSHGRCYRASAKLPVQLLDGRDENGQSRRQNHLSIQINPKSTGQSQFNRLFVHFTIDRSDATATICSSAPDHKMSASDVSPRLQRTFFSDFGLSPAQLAMAGPVLARGANVFFLYFKSEDLGLVFDSVSNEIVGIDVPKHQLETDYVFTVNRRFLGTDEVPDDSFFPLYMMNEDLTTAMRSKDIVQKMQNAIEMTKISAHETAALF